MMIGENFPEFGLQACFGDNKLGPIATGQVNGKWSVYYFYPKDFTFICPTEIKEMDRLVDEDVNVMGFSGDNEFCKLNWKESNPIIKDIRHPLVADSGLQLGHELKIVSFNDNVHYRATYIVDENNVIQHESANALDTGRSVDEIIRTLNALKSGGLTACNWVPGDNFVGE